MLNVVSRTVVNNVFRYSYYLVTQKFKNTYTPNHQSGSQQLLTIMEEKRHFDNPYPDFSPHRDNQIVDVSTKKIHPIFLEKLKSNCQKLLGILEENLPSAKRDGSVYTGSAGIALLYLSLAIKFENKEYLEKATEFAEKSLACLNNKFDVNKSLEYIERSMGGLRNKEISFICGDGGPLAIAAVIYYKLNKIDKAKECVSRLLALVPRVSSLDSKVPDELLYGRVGFLYSLMFLNKHIPDIVPNDFFKQVVTAVITSGRNLSKRENISVPLMYEWYEEYYLGGAHGIAGIMYLILQAKQYLTSEQLQLVRPTIDFLLGIRYSSGNFPSSLGSNSDRLVHWCHGAPGTVQALCAAYQVFGDPRYLHAAESCGDVVWERGLLRKGYGLCHGVAGNAYTFLVLFQLTHDVKHLYRACKFAEWCFSYNQYQTRVPDRPYSLFEGLAGTIFFLNDIQNPLTAKFPAFTV